MTNQKKWPKGTDMARLRTLVNRHISAIRQGRWIVIDPGVVSGYAVYTKGELIHSGIIKCKAGDDIQKRSRAIHELFGTETEPYDFMAIERIRGTMAPYSLMFNVGAYMACVPTNECIEVPIPVWHKLKTAEYIKSDKQDAELIGQSILMIAEEIE